MTKSFKEVKTICDTVSGYMNDRCLETLYDLADKLPDNCRILEIGVYAGKSLMVWAMAAKAKGGMAWGIDIFESNKQNPDCPDIDTVQLDLDNKIGNFLLLKGDSSLLLEKGIKEYFDLIFIDGCHDYDVVKQDIQISLLLLKDGGILCGHDYFHPPVKRAVNELLEGKKGERSNLVWIYKKEK